MKRVYFIKPIGMEGPIKIGCSVAPDRRRESLRFWSPFPLEIIAEIDGDYRLERRFHARFQHLFISHEWFQPALELCATIELIRLGEFDIDTLPPPKVLHNTGSGEPKKWTEESRIKASYTHRCAHMRQRSGFYFSSNERLAFDDAEMRAAVEAYLAAPHIHGVACMHGEAKRAAWLAKHAPESVAA